MQSFTQAPGYAWGLLSIIVILILAIGGGIFALTRKQKATAIATAHPYRRRRQVVVAVDRRKPVEDPDAVMTSAEAAALVADYRKRHPKIAKAWASGLPS